MATARKWYVETHDNHTREVISSKLPAEAELKGVLCQDGVKRDLWVCTFASVSLFLRRQTPDHLYFVIFCREGKYGPIRRWYPPKEKKQARAQALKKGTSTLRA